MSRSNPKLDFQEKQTHLIKVSEFEREYNKAQAEWNKKPYWVKAQEEGDYLPIDSGMCPGDTLDN